MQFADTSAKDIAAEAEAARKKRSDDRDCRDSDANRDSQLLEGGVRGGRADAIRPRARDIDRYSVSAKNASALQHMRGYGATQSRDYKGIVQVKPERHPPCIPTRSPQHIRWRDGNAWNDAIPAGRADCVSSALWPVPRVLCDEHGGGDAAPSKTRRRRENRNPRYPVSCTLEMRQTTTGPRNQPKN